MNTNHSLIATHPAFGTVTFVISAADAKSAFSLWKQIVHSSRQWVVQRNVSDGFREVTDTPTEYAPVDDI
jgi:hypothetical protein